MDSIQIAVYDLKQAEQFEGKFDKKMSAVRDVRKVSIKYAEMHNKNFDSSGSFYELNKVENDKFLALVKGKKEPKKKSK